MPDRERFIEATEKPMGRQFWMLRAANRTRSRAWVWLMCPKGAAHSDHALVLQKGQVVLQGTADEVADSAALSGYLGFDLRPVRPGGPCWTEV
jgi:hypothetical protein